MDAVKHPQVVWVREITRQYLALLPRIVQSMHAYEHGVALAGRVKEVLVDGEADNVLNLRHTNKHRK